MDIEFEVNCQSIKRVNNPQPANHSQKYLQLCFDFESEDWDDVAKFALFKANNTAYRESIIEDKVIVPNSCLQGNTFSFSLYGLSDDEMRITTNQVYVHLNESGYTNEIEDDFPTDDPTIVEKIYLDMETGLSLKVDTTEFNSKVSELEVSISKQAVADTGYFSTYVISQGGEALSPKINIPKDYLLKSASLKQCTVKDEPISGLNVGDWYFDWVLNTADESDETHLYLNASVLTDVYEPDNTTIVINGNVISVKADVFADKVHSHDDRYYTESEVDAIIEQVKHDLLNRISITGDKTIIQTDEVVDIASCLLDGGIPQNNKNIYFYEKIEED